MLKLMLASIITFGGYLCGSILADKMKKRRDNLKELICALTEAEGYVAANVPVGEIYKKLSGKSEVGEMFDKMSKREAAHPQRLWEEALEAVTLDEEDKKPLLEFAKTFGRSTQKSQQNSFKLCITSIGAQLEKAEEKYKCESGLYQKLGGCIGLLVSIFLM